MEKEAVVLVPGLFMGGISMAVLQRRLDVCGFEAHRFSYYSSRLTPAQNAVRLNDFLWIVRSPVVHFVGHSLGGLVLRHLFARFPDQRPGRVVTLGTPHCGSFVAARLARVAPLRWLLGASLREGLLGEVPPWQDTHPLAVIAGTLSLGAGELIPGLAKPNDGTVAVIETELPGMRAHVQLPVTHTGLLVSPVVVRYVCEYLKTGAFPDDAKQREDDDPVRATCAVHGGSAEAGGAAGTAAGNQESGGGPSSSPVRR
ncbi:MAG: esterase/lipase family protein [Gammaproteobacteria bacterium]